MEAGPIVELSIATQGETMGMGSRGVDSDTKVVRRGTPEVTARGVGVGRDPSRELTGNYSHGLTPIFEAWLPGGIALC